MWNLERVLECCTLPLRNQIKKNSQICTFHGSRKAKNMVFRKLGLSVGAIWDVGYKFTSWFRKGVYWSDQMQRYIGRKGCIDKHQDVFRIQHSKSMLSIVNFVFDLFLIKLYIKSGCKRFSKFVTQSKIVVENNFSFL